MKVFRIVIITLVVVVALASIVGLFLPSSVSVSRSVTIDAPKPKVFAIINSLRAFSRWSPWTERDPNIKFRFEGPESGVGQKMYWQSTDKNVGTGSMEIVDSVTNATVAMKIMFGGQGHAGSSLAIGDPVGGGTEVVWGFYYSVGSNPFARYLALIMPSVVGKEYAQGLARLKKYVEAIPNVDASDLQVSRVSLAPRTFVSVTADAPNAPDAVIKTLRDSYAKITSALTSSHIATDGDPISIVQSVKDNMLTIEASIPVKDLPNEVKLPDGLHEGKAEAGEALRVSYKGDVSGLGTIYLKLVTYALSNGWKARGSSWNEYLSEPTAAGQFEANIYLPVD